jgi:hypothetical protein
LLKFRPSRGIFTTHSVRGCLAPSSRAKHAARSRFSFGAFMTSSVGARLRIDIEVVTRLYVGPQPGQPQPGRGSDEPEHELTGKRPASARESVIRQATATPRRDGQPDLGESARRRLIASPRTKAASRRQRLIANDEDATRRPVSLVNVVVISSTCARVLESGEIGNVAVASLDSAELVTAPPL